eukprot:CAMPEP_0119395322 /NCGR_PEP_ID=MMETSP1334-20130426/132920_1 /TAXON_ID=127549 /ORGANISM="Calcidiscus leptoporus, Strain RCC1130" /LENGTH=40 /DNA_ID= /DNA_START= /DNA_END= /DNA_ORIENTATION=
MRCQDRDKRRHQTALDVERVIGAQEWEGFLEGRHASRQDA